MILGDRLRAMREAKSLKQRDIADRAGLQCAYISRVENGHTVPALPTLEKLARALEVPLYRLFWEGTGRAPSLDLGGPTPEGRRELELMKELRSYFGDMDDGDRELLLALVRKMRDRSRNRAYAAARYAERKAKRSDAAG